MALAKRLKKLLPLLLKLTIHTYLRGYLLHPCISNEKRFASYLIYQTGKYNKLIKFVSQPIYKDKASFLMALSNVEAIKM